MEEKYLKIDPWKIIEQEWNPEKVIASESIFSLGNGTMGMRANFEENYSGNTFQGSYIGGIYYPDKTKVGWWKNGYPEFFAKVLNAPSWIGIDVRVNGESIDLAKAKVHNFQRILDMQKGCYNRNFEITTPAGVRLQVSTTRFLSLKRTEVGAIKYAVTPINQNIDLELCSYLDGIIVNQDSNWDNPFWKPLKQQNSPSFSALLNRTNKSAFGVCTFMTNTFKVAEESPLEPSTTTASDERIGTHFSQSLAAGSTATLIKLGGYLTTLNHDENALIDAAQALASQSMKRGFDTLLEEHQEAWAEIWNSADIQIEGDVAAQQGIRFNIFQLNQTYSGSDARLNIGPKGFTGEKYGGSTYWDTEAYCLPFYMATKPPEVARNLLKYRYQHLDKAIENAEKLGFSNGAALFPMVTINGEECHNEWEITFQEIHRNGAIAFAIFNYTRYTGDHSFLLEMGLEVLIAIARFWAQRLSWSTQKEKYVMLGVTGPNEYENNIDNNWYTNYIAQWCLLYTQEQLEWVARTHPEVHAECITKMGVGEEECQQWGAIAGAIYFPISEEHGIFLQQDNFLEKELIPANQLNPKERPLNQHWSWDRILRSPYIKQADVLQGFYMFAPHFTEEELERHYEFYEPFTVHESSLSSSIHSVIAARLNRMDEAYDFYLRTARMDLDDYNKEVEEGLHITSMAGTWISIVEGFGGLTFENNCLSLSPKLPDCWESFTFKIQFRGAVLQVHQSKEQTKFHWGGDQPLSILLHDKPLTVSPS